MYINCKTYLKNNNLDLIIIIIYIVYYILCTKRQKSVKKIYGYWVVIRSLFYQLSVQLSTRHFILYKSARFYKFTFDFIISIILFWQNCWGLGVRAFWEHFLYKKDFNTCTERNIKIKCFAFRSGEVDPEDQGVQPSDRRVQREGDLRGLLRAEGVHLRKTTRKNCRHGHGNGRCN